MFIDASALCAILLREPDRELFHRAIAEENEFKATSAIAIWETMRAIVRETRRDVADVQRVIDTYLDGSEVDLVLVGTVEQRLAVAAFNQFGKGRHPAALNMGDCFAYACAVANDLPLLFKGEDFALTDIRPALPPE